MITARIEPGTKLAAIVGPTAVGKTAVALKIAPRLDAEIISVDAMQIYKGLDIGTGKPTKDELKAVRFHMLDIADPSESFSVARFKELVDNEVFITTSRGKLPLLVGGSGLYYRAVVDDLDFANTSGTDLYRVEVVEELGEGSGLIPEALCLALGVAVHVFLVAHQAPEMRSTTTRASSSPRSSWRK